MQHGDGESLSPPKCSESHDWAGLELGANNETQ